MTQKLRILAIGDCNTSGVSGSQHLNVPRSLCRLLNEDGIETDLTNLGATMNTSREGIARARDYKYPADVVLLNFGLVDAWQTALPDLYISYYPDRKIKRFFRGLLKSLKKRIRSPFWRKVLPQGWCVEIREYRDNMQQIIDIVRTHSPSAQIIVWGSAPTRLNAERSGWLADYDLVLADLAAKGGHRYLDTKTLLAPYATEAIFQDHVHLSPQGYDIVAAGMKPLLNNIDSKTTNP